MGFREIQKPPEFACKALYIFLEARVHSVGKGPMLFVTFPTLWTLVYLSFFRERSREAYPLSWLPSKLDVDLASGP